MTDLSAEALRKLKGLAEKAAKGKRFVAGHTAGNRGWEVGLDKSRNRICCDATESEARYIAAASPDVILALLAERERLLDVLKEFVNLNVDIVCAKADDKRKIEALHDKAMAALAAAGEE